MVSNPKDPQYEARVPAFLVKLRNDISNRADDPDRHTSSVNRSGKPTPDELERQVYVLDESGATLSKAEFDHVLAGGEADRGRSSAPASLAMDADTAGGRKTGDVGSTKRPNASSLQHALSVRKRKAGRIVGSEPEYNAEYKSKRLTEGNELPRRPIEGRKKVKRALLSFD